MLQGVSWKTSVKNYKRRAFSNVSHSYFVMKERNHKPEKPYSFKIMNRGKTRSVEAITIKERVIQKCFCDYGFVDNLSKRLIYDNYATLKKKGMWVCLKRLNERYRKFMDKYKDTGYVLVLDFHNYFYSIDHTLLYEKVRRFIDHDCFIFYKTIVDNMEGLNLGSQLSQISAVYFSYMFDEICQRKADVYGRYMDDSYCLFRNKKDLKESLSEIMKVVQKLHLEINSKKVKILKASNGFTFLKKVVHYKENKSMISPRRDMDRIILQKMKKLHKIRPDQVKKSLICYRPFYTKLRGYRRFQNILKLMMI